MPAFTEYPINGKIYVDLKQLLPLRPYGVGCKSISQLIAKKHYQSIINGQIIDGVLVVKEKRSYKLGSVFVEKSEILDLFDEHTIEIVEYPPAPAVIEDEDLIFFKDDEGIEHSVLMRGERTRQGIYFKVKDVERVFEMKRLDDILGKDHTGYTPGMDFQWFVLPRGGKELYLTFSGLRGLITRSSILNCSTDIGYIYLIRLDPSGNLYKFGKTWNPMTRFDSHRCNFAKHGYESIELVHTVMVDVDRLSVAEASVKSYLIDKGFYRSLDCSTELAELDESEVSKLIAFYQELADKMVSVGKGRSVARKLLDRMLDFENEMILTAAFGTVDQKAKTFARVLNIDAVHLRAVMNKTDGKVICLYLIDIKQIKDGRHVFKLGYSKHLRTRFSEHMRKYGDNIELIRFVFIPESSLSHAETLLKKISITHAYEREGEKELIALDDQDLESVLTTYDTISQLFCGNLREVVEQHSRELNEMKHLYEMKQLEANHKVELAQLEIKLLRERLAVAGL